MYSNVFYGYVLNTDKTVQFLKKVGYKVRMKMIEEFKLPEDIITIIVSYCDDIELLNNVLFDYEYGNEIDDAVLADYFFKEFNIEQKYQMFFYMTSEDEIYQYNNNVKFHLVFKMIDEGFLTQKELNFFNSTSFKNWIETTEKIVAIFNEDELVSPTVYSEMYYTLSPIIPV